MPSAIPFVSAIDGTPILVNPNAVQVVIPVADDLASPAPVPSSRVISFAGPANEVQVLGSAAAVVAALGTGPNMVAIPISQALSGPTPFSGPDAYFGLNGPLPYFEDFLIPNDPQPYTRVSFVANGDIVVQGTPAAVSALILTGFGPSGPGPEARTALQFLCDPSGNVSLLVSDSGYSVALTNPHVAGSGLYEFTLIGAPPGYQYMPAVQSPAARFVSVARAVAPGSPNFLVSLSAPTRTWAAGRIAAGGGTLAALNLTANLVPPNTYQCTVTTPTPPGTFAAVAVSEEPGKLATTNPTGPSSFDISVTDLLGAPATGSLAVTVTGIDNGTGNEGFPPVDDFFLCTLARA